MIPRVLVFMVVLVVGLQQCLGVSKGDIAGLIAKRASGQELTQQEYEGLCSIVGDFSDDQLALVRNTGKWDMLRGVCQTELLARTALSPHWTVVPSFWLIIISNVVAVAALILALRAELRVLRSERGIASLSASQLSAPATEPLPEETNRTKAARPKEARQI